MNVTRRIVTGHTKDGRSVVVSDGPVPNVRSLPGGARFDEVWAVDAAPPTIGLTPANEPTTSGTRIARGSGAGNVIRVIEFPPVQAGGKRSPMHRTQTIDYGIVLEGEMVLILTDSEVELKAGDVVVQRGTDHAWENRAQASAKMAFILIDAVFDHEVAALIKGALLD